MKQSVVGVFDQFAAAQHAARLLQDRGIDADSITSRAATATMNSWRTAKPRRTTRASCSA